MATEILENLVKSDKSIQQTLLLTNVGEKIAAVPETDKIPSVEEIENLVLLFDNTENALTNGISIFQSDELAQIRQVSSANDVLIISQGLIASFKGDKVLLVLTKDSSIAPEQIVVNSTKIAAEEINLLGNQGVAPPLPPKMVKHVSARNSQTFAPAAAKEAAKPSPLATTSTTTNELKTCDGCSKPIDESQTTIKTSENGTYHKGCLQCADCQVDLVGTFTVIDERHLCVACGVRCHVCSKALTGEYLRLPDGRSVHRQCAPQKPCCKCQKNIEATESSLEADGRPFHKQCFRCDDCQESIVSFVPDENDVNVLRCKSCADKKLATEEQQAQSKPKQQKKKSASGWSSGIVCVACKQEIPEGKFVRCIEQPYHIACLKCGQCQKVLGAGDEIYKKNNQPHCADCGKYAD